MKVKANRETRSHIIDIAEVFQAEIVDVEPDSIIIEVTGDENKIDSLVNLLRDYEIIELVRTGRVAMLRGPEVSHPHDGRGRAVRARAGSAHVVASLYALTSRRAQPRDDATCPR